MRRSSYLLPISLLAWTALSIAGLGSQAWGDTGAEGTDPVPSEPSEVIPPSVALTTGQPAPYPGILLHPHRAALATAALAALELAELDLQVCRDRSREAVADLAQRVLPCPQVPPESSPWPDRWMGVGAGAGATLVLVLAIVLAR